MNVLQGAQDNSTLAALLDKNKKTSPFEYNLVGNVPTYSRMKTVWSAEKTLNYSSTMSVELPRYGILENLWIQFKNKTANTGKTTPYAPIFAFSSYELRARSKVVARLYPQDIVSFYKSQKAELLSVAKPLQTLNSNIDSGTYTGTPYDVDKYSRFMLPFSAMSKLQNAYNLKFMEPVELHLITTSAKANIISNAASTQHIKVGCDFILPNAQEEERLKSLMVRAGPQGISRLQWSSIRDTAVSFAGATAGQAESVDLRVPYPTFRTVLKFRCSGGNDIDNVGGSGKSGIGQMNNAMYGSGDGGAVAAYQNGVGRIQLTSSGVVLWERDVHDLRLMSATGSHRYDADWTAPLVIDWNMSGDATNQTGFISFKNLADPKLVFIPVGTTGYLTVDGNVISGGTNKLEVEITHHYYTLEQVSPDDGSVRVRVLT